MQDPHQQQLSRFELRKKINRYFVLNSNCVLYYDGTRELKSNNVLVISPINRYYKEDYTCSTPYWRK
jgi:hypothetical protein